MPKAKDWYSTAEDVQLRRMKREGLSVVEAAHLLGRSENSLRERARRLGIAWSLEAGTSGLVTKKSTDFRAERDGEIRHRQADRAFIRALALAFLRGDHLPAGQERPLVLVG